MSADERFEYFRDRIGLSEADCLKLDSPYDFREQAKVIIEDDLPDPNDHERFVPAAAATIEEHVGRSRGRSLVLFTSYHMMRSFADDSGFARATTTTGMS